MMLSVSPSCIVRSSLEDMLEALQRRDENETPRDVPPPLPRRAVSRSRPPSAKRRLPVSSEAEETRESSGLCVTKGAMRGHNKSGAVEDFELVHQGNCEAGQKGLQHLPELNTAVITFQSYVRGEIARKEYNALLRLKKQDIQENLDHQTTLPLVEELQKRVSIIEATLELKEKENASLREQVEHYKARWSEFEAKKKSSEVAWQKQIASLQMDLAASRKSAVAESTIVQPAAGEKKAGFSNGVKEFKARKFPGLKRMIKAWTKDYKVRVRDSNMNIHPVGHSEGADRQWRTWWGRKSKKF